MSDGKTQDKEVRQFTVGYDDDDIRLDRWFKRHLPDTSFTTVAKWARTGQLRVDGSRAAPGDRIKAGQVLRVPSVAIVTEHGTGPRLNLVFYAFAEEERILLVVSPAEMDTSLAIELSR